MRHLAETEIVEARAAIHDCWNMIGVRGDQSCPELKRHSHCHNCPAYSAAAAMLLDRDMPAQSSSEWTSHYAQAKAGEERKTNSAILFRLGAEWFALSTLVLDEVAALRPIHSLPHRRSPAVLGLINVRGELLICVSLARLLGGETAAAPEGRLIVARHESGRVAFPVDEVQHTHSYHPDELKRAPATIAKSAASFTRGLLSWRDRMVGVLDEQLVIQALNRTLA
jgi:chemotaxis signal transduction protein